ncbi:MAG: Rpn family recombination-promoting nuclease/putative transposase [Myxococcota bacterium]
MASAKRPPHDQFLKEILSKPEHAAGVLRIALTEDVGEWLDWSTLRLINGSYVDADLRASFSDLVFEIDARGGGEALVYCLWENQTTEDPMMPLRQLSYACNALRQYRERRDVMRDRLPFVIPLLLYTGGRWTKARQLSELTPPLAIEEGPYLDLRMEVLELNRAQLDRFEQARAHCDATSRAALVAVARGLSGRERGERLSRLFVEVRLERGVEALLPFWKYIGGAYRRELETIMSTMNPEVEREARDFFDELRAEGEARGRIEGEARTLLRLLELKFGPPTRATQQRLEGAGVEQLDRWVERVLTAATLEEVFAEPQA